ncbi:MAG: adenylate/guanylate cyclase domain-containing protein, partial [Deltaproteobacteria bacterium]|nr:adenylate/guanylate cyclase domain-containing protein [Deltaproteobacteria bacterium]
VGNIGSSKRSKYSVVGSGVNQTSRIESYTVGGQILISESVLKEAGGVLRIDGQRKVLPKGTVTSLWIYEIGGIASQYNLALERKDLTLATLTLKLPIQCTILKGKHIGKKGLKGFVVRLSKKSAEIALKKPVDLFADLKMNLIDVYEELAAKDFYGKVIERLGKTEFNYVVRFTSVQPEIVSYFLAHQQIAVKPIAE